jgi:hypothetical protein
MIFIEFYPYFLVLQFLERKFQGSSAERVLACCNSRVADKKPIWVIELNFMTYTRKTPRMNESSARLQWVPEASDFVFL